MVIQCAKCGAENPDWAKSCNCCGMEFNYPVQGMGIGPKKSGKPMCPKCGYIRAAGDLTCPICGHQYP